MLSNCAASCYAKSLLDVQLFKLEAVKWKKYSSLTWDINRTPLKMCSSVVFLHIKNIYVLSCLKQVIQKSRKFHFLIE